MGFNLLTPHSVNYTECMRRWNELQSRNTNASPNSPTSQWPFEEVATKVPTSLYSLFPFPYSLFYSLLSTHGNKTDSASKCTRYTHTTLVLAQTRPLRPFAHLPPPHPLLLLLPLQNSAMTPLSIPRLTNLYQTQWWTNSCAMSPT